MNNNFKNHSLSGRENCGKYIAIIARHLSYLTSKNLKCYNLGVNEYHYLIQIYLNEGLCQEDIVKRCRTDKYEVAKGIKQLINKNYIYKIKDINDKRKHRIYLTEYAKEIKEDFIRRLDESANLLTKNFSKEEKKQVLSYLVRMSDNIYEEILKLKENR